MRVKRRRSRVKEASGRDFSARRVRAAREDRDLAILNESADPLNREMDDVLAYQAPALPASRAVW